MFACKDSQSLPIFIGNQVSVTTKYGNIFKGILYDLDGERISLAKVKFYGTHDGSSHDGQQLESTAGIYEFIIFRVNDIKSIDVIEPPKPVSAFPGGFLTALAIKIVSTSMVHSATCAETSGFCAESSFAGAKNSTASTDIISSLFTSKFGSASTGSTDTVLHKLFAGSVPVKMCFQDINNCMNNNAIDNTINNNIIARWKGNKVLREGRGDKEEDKTHAESIDLPNQDQQTRADSPANKADSQPMNVNFVEKQVELEKEECLGKLGLRRINNGNYADTIEKFLERVSENEHGRIAYVKVEDELEKIVVDGEGSVESTNLPAPEEERETVAGSSKLGKCHRCYFRHHGRGDNKGTIVITVLDGMKGQRREDNPAQNWVENIDLDGSVVGYKRMLTDGVDFCTPFLPGPHRPGYSSVYICYCFAC